ncbi:MAG: hypothetical protein M0R22_01085 [Dehalococcoidia bacterium]|jgi:hypothetical protein|nr:hypothetical protein [Dehalococcoidia bacterium]
MDPVAAVLADLYDVLTADATLKTLSGGTVRLFRGEAAENPDGLYFVHDLSWNSEGGDDWAVCAGPEYTLEIFIDSNVPDSVDAAADRIVRLLEGRTATTPEGDAHYSLSYFSGGDIPTGTHTEWQRSLVFWILAVAKGQVAAIV